MTRVAVVEWWPRVCGATDSAVHLAAGARDAGVEVDLVTFSKSGRVLKKWERPERFAVYRRDEAVEVLDAYDLVLLSDLVCFAPEVMPSRKERRELPFYVDVLRELRTPWTTLFYGNPYHARHDETIQALFETPSFSGWVVTPRLPEARAKLPSYAARAGVELRFVDQPYAPYDPARAATPPPLAKRRKALLMTARLMTNKGQDTALDLFRDLAGDLDLWGFNSFGLPSVGHRLWELGRALGYDTPMKRPELRKDVTAKHPNAYRFYGGRWEFHYQGRKAEYFDAYSSLDDIDWTPWVHASFASRSFGGILEYASLDALFSGCVVTLPEHGVEYVGYRTIPTFPFESGSCWPNAKGEVRRKFNGDRERTLEVLNGLLKTGHRRLAAMAAAQRAEVAEKHAPGPLLREVVDTVLGGSRSVARRRRVQRPPNPGTVSTTRVAAAVEKTMKTTEGVPTKLPKPRGRKPAALGAYIFAGGFTLGVRDLFDVKAHFEDGDYGVATARAAFPDLPIHTDVDRWPWDQYAGAIDFLYGNPPCAAWSPLGPRAQKGIGAWKTDPRVDCTRAYFQLFELMRPAVWAWESVPQAFTQGRPLVDHLASRAAKLGYAVDYVLHNARYVGARQSRKRFFFVATRVDVDWACPWTDCPGGFEALADLPVNADPTTITKEYYQKAFLAMVKPGEALRAVYPRYLERLQLKHGDALTEEKRKKLAPRPSFGERRLPDERPAGAVVDSMIVHPRENRYLTIGEMAWLGGWPVDYPLAGNTHDAKARQLTRAVLPPVGRWLGANVRAALDRGTPAPVGRVREVNLTKPPGAIAEL